MMRMFMALAVTVLLGFFGSSAEARTHHHHGHYRQMHRHYHHIHRNYHHVHHGYRHTRHRNHYRHAYRHHYRNAYRPDVSRDFPGARTQIAGGHQLGGRPAAWCGWYMRSQVGSDPGPSYNLARSWAHYGSNAGGPHVGAIVVWRHHVGKIVGQQNGQWIIQSGNDGHAVRTRPRSLAGAIAFRNAYASF
jgi:hypothetical protein